MADKQKDKTALTAALTSTHLSKEEIAQLVRDHAPEVAQLLAPKEKKAVDLATELYEQKLPTKGAVVKASESQQAVTYHTSRLAESMKYDGSYGQVWGLYLKRIIAAFNKHNDMRLEELSGFIYAHLAGSAKSDIDDPSIDTSDPEQIVSRLRSVYPDTVKLDEFRQTIMTGSRYEKMSIVSMLDTMQADMTLLKADIPEMKSVINARFGGHDQIRYAIAASVYIYGGSAYVAEFKRALRVAITSRPDVRDFVNRNPAERRPSNNSNSASGGSHRALHATTVNTSSPSSSVQLF
ncbi:hypothetical protein GQ42DRAFT_7834 [Ramicandelaber brevisporus]|nr:hypothetical protein GQ42DRAFT_7834 [Ramicandelaber brevisporus]